MISRQFRILEDMLVNPSKLVYSGQLNDFKVSESDIKFSVQSGAIAAPSSGIMQLGNQATLDFPAMLYSTTGSSRYIFVGYSAAFVTSESYATGVDTQLGHIAYGGTSSKQLISLPKPVSYGKLYRELVDNSNSQMVPERYRKPFSNSDFEPLPNLWIFGCDDTSESIHSANISSVTTSSPSGTLVLRGVLIECTNRIAYDQLKNAIRIDGIGPDFWSNQMNLPFKTSLDSIISAHLKATLKMYYPQAVSPALRIHRIKDQFRLSANTTLTGTSTSFVGGSALLSHTFANFESVKRVRNLYDNARWVSTEKTWDTLSLYLNGVGQTTPDSRRLVQLSPCYGQRVDNAVMRTLVANPPEAMSQSPNNGNMYMHDKLLVPNAYFRPGDGMYLANEDSSNNALVSTSNMFELEGWMFEFNNESAAIATDGTMRASKGGLMTPATMPEIARWVESER